MKSPVRGVAAALLAAVLAVGTAAGCGADDPPVPAGQLRIATGFPGGVYFTYGRGIADAVRRRIPELGPSVLETAASAENLRLVAAGSAEVGFAQSDTAAVALADGADVVALVRLYDDYLHLIVRRGSGIEELADLAGRRVSIGAPESGTAFTVRRLLTTEGLDPSSAIVARNLGLDDSAAALERGEIDAFFFSGGLPTARVTELTRRVAVELVSLGQYVGELRTRFGPFYAEHTVPGSTYGLTTRTTIGVPNYLVVPAGMPAATAYALTRTLFEEQDALRRVHPVAARLNSREAIFTDPLRLHPGAARYFREVKP